MKKILELREQRGALFTQASELMATADRENRDMSGEEKGKWDKIMVDVDSLKEKIDMRERQHALEQEMNQRASDPIRGKADGKKTGVNSEEYREAFTAWLRNGAEGCTPEQRSLMAEHRAQSVGTTTAGGFTVAQGFYGSVVEAMKFYGGMRNVATVMPTTTGNDIPIPTMNDTASIGELVAENAAVTTGDIPFGQVTLKAYKYSSKTILVSYELLQDSSVDLQSLIAKQIGNRIGRITNSHFTTGTGTAQPQGIVTGSTLGKTGTAGQTTSVIYDDLIDLVYSVDPAYRQMGNVGFMLHDTSFKALRKLKDSQGRPLWEPSLQAGVADTLLGYKMDINNDMPVMAANAKSILFGDMSNYIIRDVMDLQLFQIRDKYIESGQVGFLAFYRGDGKMVDAGMHPVSYYANSAT